MFTPAYVVFFRSKPHSNRDLIREQQKKGKGSCEKYNLITTRFRTKTQNGIKSKETLLDIRYYPYNNKSLVYLQKHTALYFIYHRNLYDET